MGSRMEVATSVAELVGLVLIAVGVCLAWLPAGLVVAGAELVLVGWFLAPVPQRGRAR